MILIRVCLLFIFSVTKGIVALHGGTISVHSQGEGHGSTFAVELPLYQGSALSAFECSCSLGSRSFNGIAETEYPSVQRVHSTGSVTAPANSPSFIPRTSFTGLEFPETKDTREVPTREEASCICVHGNQRARESRSLSVMDVLEYRENSLSARRSLELLALDDGSSVRVYSRARVTPFANPMADKKVEVLRETTIHRRNSVSRRTKMRVLVVDDAATNRKMTCRSLRDTFGEIEEASDGADAVRKVRLSIETKRPYDLILMDFIMPNMDGPTATKIIRDELGFTGTIVGLTGNALQSDINTFLLHGAEKVLVKPVTLHIS